MTILTIIIVGAIVGWIAGRVMGRREGLISSILIGIIGSFIGSILSKLLTGGDRAYLAFSWSGFFWSLIGAIILVAILNAISHPRSHNTTV